MTLSECPPRRLVRVIGVAVTETHLLRAREIGIREGSVLRVTQRAAFGGVVLALGGARLAIDGRTARGITVEEVAA